jgi:serine/threonine-protein kinase RsbW
MQDVPRQVRISAGRERVFSVVETTRYAVRLRIPAKAEYITLCRLALSGLSSLGDVSEEALADLKLALTEACSNSVRHAYEADHSGAVDIVYEFHDDRVVIEVSDDGRGFRRDEGVGPPEELNESGLGIAIIRALSDELELGRRADGRGSRLRIVKRIG